MATHDSNDDAGEIEFWEDVFMRRSTSRSKLTSAIANCHQLKGALSNSKRDLDIQYCRDKISEIIAILSQVKEQ